MQSLILAAGYATRLYPLTKNFPKPLLEIGGKTILDRLISDLDQIDSIIKHIIISNHSFLHFFENWKKQSPYNKEILILNDGTTSNDNRLGAVKDIISAIEQLDIKDDIIVLAGDNVVNFSFDEFVKFSILKQSSCISFHHEPNIRALQKTGVLETDESNKVIDLQEKPEIPKSDKAVPPFYIYNQKDLPLIKNAIVEGCNFDAPGNLASWLSKKTDVYAWQISGNRYDIGDIESYQLVNDMFSKG